MHADPPAARARRLPFSRLLVLLVTTIGLFSGGVALAQDKGGEGNFVIPPYLLDVTTESATVAFQLAQPSSAEVVLHGDAEATRFRSPEVRPSHFVKVTGLSPGRTYRYEVVASEAGIHTPRDDAGYQIRTAARAGESFTFTVYGDPRPGENQTHRHHRLLIDQMVQVEPAFSLVLGDLVDDGSDPEQWQRFFELEAPLRRRAAIFPVLGDNDYAAGRGLAARYFPSSGPPQYHFQWGDVHFFGMHAWGTLGEQPRAELDESSPQLRWLEEQLSLDEVQRAAFRVVFLHDPIYITRGRSADLLRRVWAPLLSEKGVDLVFASWHLYERARHDGVTYVISGGAGAELVWLDQDPTVPSQAEARRHHFCRVDVKAGALQLRAIAEDGTVLDTITLLPHSGEHGEAAAELARRARRIGQEIRFGPTGAAALELYLFAYDCPYCVRLLERDLPQWAREQAVALRVRYYDLSQPGAYDLLMAAGADFGRQDAEIPTLFVGRSVFGGEAEIGAGVPGELEAFRSDPEAYQAQAFVPFERARDTQSMRAARFEALNLGVVLAAGLIDGVNPCAFTTIIFLLSYLSLAGGTRRQILVAGGLFTLAVFVTYVAIGVLFLQFAGALLAHHGLARVIHLVLLALLVTFAALSIVDAVRSFRGRPTEIALKLPEFLQQRIRARVRTFAKNNAAAGAAAFSLGVVIASMELACTGQVYLPIVTMIAEPRYRASATLDLLAYNAAFIAPLLALFLLSAFGLTSQRLARLARRHVGTVKLALALLFIALALVVLYNLGWLS